MNRTHAASNSRDRLPRAYRVARLGFGVLLLGGIACSEEPPRPRGLLDAEGKPLEGVQPRSAAPVAPATEQERAPEALPSPFGDGQEQAEGAVAAAAPEAEKREERDLSAELKAILGQPTSCLDLDKVATGGGNVTVRVIASVMPSGSINRASASAAGQDGAALRCIEQRVLSGSLKGPIEGAPLAVTAESVIEAVKVAPPAPKTVEAPRPAPSTIAQAAEGAQIAAPADDVELAAPPDDEPVELAQPAD